MKTKAASLFVAVALAAAGCSAKSDNKVADHEGATAPLFGDLGGYHHPITTSSELAQEYFDQGLILAYGFNHAEAIRSFREAQRLDPECAMCAWGAAYALGPNINMPMSDEAVPEAWTELQKAKSKAAGATPREQAYIEALSARYTEQPVSDRSSYDRAYANAMRQVIRAYPDDLDAAAIYAEAVMNTMPWDYYEEDGRPKEATVEVIETLEFVMNRNPDHAGAIHFYIHAVEASQTAERAEAPADRLAKLAPGAGHLVHMPSHIYYRIGRYHDASEANVLAADADESYISQCRAQGFYPAAYYPHNIHFLWASSTAEGRSKLAVESAERLNAAVSDDILSHYPFLEEFRPSTQVTLVRFGRWAEVLETGAPPENLVYSTGMWHYARGVAAVRLGHSEMAQDEYRKLQTIAADERLADLVLFSGSSAPALLSIASHVLAGEIAASRKDWETAISEFSEAVVIEDSLPYTEPPPWYFSTRLALGKAYLQAGQPAEAEIIYRDAVEYRRRNGWALFGLAQSLKAQGKSDSAEAVQARFAEARQRADVELQSSVF
jgi:tetratricopeptide (TPR) repeat protein